MFCAISGAFGRKPVVLLSLTLFTIGTIVCGASPNIAVLLVGRCLQGIGGGSLTALTYVVMADVYTLAERSKRMGLVSLTWLVGAVVGPVMGGGFTEKATWVRNSQCFPRTWRADYL